MLWIKIQGFTINFKRKTKKIILDKKNFINFFLQTIIIKCHLKTFLLRWGSELWIYILILTSFVYILSYINICGSGSRILIRIPNTDPDPEGSWIRIRIHNTAQYCYFQCSKVKYRYRNCIKSWCIWNELG